MILNISCSRLNEKVICEHSDIKYNGTQLDNMHLLAVKTARQNGSHMTSKEKDQLQLCILIGQANYGQC